MAAWYASLDGEIFDAGPYPTSAETLRLAPADLAIDTADRFWIARKVKWTPEVDARQVIEQVGADAFEAAGPDADDFLSDVPVAAVAALAVGLQRALDQWLEATGLGRELFQLVDKAEAMVDHEGYGHVLS